MNWLSTWQCGFASLMLPKKKNIGHVVTYSIVVDFSFISFLRFLPRFRTLFREKCLKWHSRHSAMHTEISGFSGNYFGEIRYFVFGPMFQTYCIMKSFREYCYFRISNVLLFCNSSTHSSINAIASLVNFSVSMLLLLFSFHFLSLIFHFELCASGCPVPSYGTTIQNVSNRVIHFVQIKPWGFVCAATINIHTNIQTLDDQRPLHMALMTTIHFIQPEDQN